MPGVEEFAHTAARGTYYAGRVALVYHHKGVVFFGQVADFVHRSHIAVHGEHSVGADDAETLCLSFLQAAFEVGHVGIGIAIAHGLAKAHTVDDGSVVERVADDGIVGREQGLKHTAVGIEASGIENGVFGLKVVADGGLELLVDVGRAANEAHTRHAEAAGVHGIFGSLDEAGIVRQTQIVVGAEVEHCFAAHFDGSLLGAFDEALFLVEAGFAKVFQLLLEVFLKFSVHDVMDYKVFGLCRV